MSYCRKERVSVTFDFEDIASNGESHRISLVARPLKGAHLSQHCMRGGGDVIVSVRSTRTADMHASIQQYYIIWSNIIIIIISIGIFIFISIIVIVIIIGQLGTSNPWQSKHISNIEEYP